MKPYKGKITSWKIEHRGLYHVVVGEQDGAYICTSIIYCINFIAQYVETQNSLYQLDGPPRL